MYDVEFGEKEGELNLSVRYSYPRNDEYDIVAYLERINFEEEKYEDLKKGKGFIVSVPQKSSLKKDIKNPDGIFSTKFGQRLGDLNPYIDQYSCQCGNLKSAINNGLECPKCGTICKHIGDDFSIFGWIEIDREYGIINPDMFKLLDSFFGRSKHLKNKRAKKGSVLMNMIEYDKEIDQNGHEVGDKIKSGEPYYGIGMIEFKNRFDEIFEYYYSKNKKKEIYEDIMVDRDKLFINSIPVFTTLLRPMDIFADTMYYEKTNGYYNMMVKGAQQINKNKRKIDRVPKAKNHQLFRFQMKYMALYDEVVNILNEKKGQLRTLLSGRFNFSSRCVIKQNPKLRIDQVELPYAELVIANQQKIINILHRMYNISYQEAYDKWYKSIGTVDQTIVNIIEDMIKQSGEGLPVIINRNPTISFGSILQMFCVGINFNYTMSTPLQVLAPLAADYDGDVLNVFHIINEDFFLRANEVFNPRNAMYISRNNGMMNLDVMVQKDTMVNANTLNDLSLHEYTKEELDHINAIKERAKMVA